jgi:glycosyltransferase involved in cell wall biosynthesis
VVYTRDLGLAALLLRLPRVKRPRVVYESHGLAPVVAEELPRLLGRATPASAAKIARLTRRERLVWQRAAAYVTITQALADELTARFGARPAVFVVPDAARGAIAASAGAPGMTPGGGVAVYAGHLYPWKGVDVFVRALAHLPGVRGRIVGGHPAEPDLARVRSLVRALGLDERVEITGLVPPADVAGHLAAASALVLPNVPAAISERYTSPLKLFEYLAAGKPIVASNLAAIREVVTHGEHAWLVTPGDPEALAAGQRHVLEEPGVAAHLGRGARRLAPQFTWAARAARLRPVLEVAAP